jgi:hypothetical protein
LSAAWVLVVAALLTQQAAAQNPMSHAGDDMLPPAETVTPMSGAEESQNGDGKIEQTGCSSCAKGVLGSHGPSQGCSSCGNGGCGNGNCCYPGYEPCDCCFDQTNVFTRVIGGIYECICCPDPCYESKWRVLADSAFFADNPRPQTQMRFRAALWNDFAFPDKAEYLWARINGKGPRGPANRGVRNTDVAALRMYTEGATGMIGVFVETNYVRFEPDPPFTSASGFGDLVVGTKTQLLDCELVEFAFQFKTFIPTGSFTKGLGTGHTSLEPSLLLALKLTPRLFFQGQFAYNFPIGGTQAAGNTPGVQGPLFHYHMSLNRMLWECGADKGIQVVGVLEFGGYEICGGSYTNPANGVLLPARDVGSVFQAGPGIRVNVCNTIDFGVGSQFAITDDNFGDQQIHVDFRWRF